MTQAVPKVPPGAPAGNDCAARAFAIAATDLYSIEAAREAVSDAASLLENLGSHNGEAEFSPRGLHLIASALHRAAGQINRAINGDAADKEGGE